MLRNARIAVRLSIGFGIVILLFILMALFTRIEMGTIAGLTTRMYEHPFTVTKSVIDAETDIVRMERDIKDLLLARDSAEIATSVKAIDASERDALEHLRVVHELYLGDKREIEAVIKELDVWRAYREKVIALIRANKREEAVALHKSTASRQISTIEKQMEAMRDFASVKATSFVTGAKETAEKTYILVYLLVIVAVILSISIAFLISRPIIGPLKGAVKAANNIAGGDLSVTMPREERKDEVGDLTRAFAGMMRYLQEMAGVSKRIAGGDLTVTVKPVSEKDLLGNAFAEMIGNLRTVNLEIREGVQVLASSVSEILASTTQLASVSSETAASVNETTSTVEEVKQTARLSAEKSRSVSEGAQKAVAVGEQGAAAVAETTAGINHTKSVMETVTESIVRMSEQTQAIGEIMAVVNDLAQQSNLLSVNAAIEAAKAGEHGKGFAVVAQEIRSLADQSKEATGQVRTILSDIQKATSTSVLAAEQVSKAVEGSVNQAAESGEAIRKLADSIEESAHAATQIAASNQQQFVGMDQIAQAMEAVRQASQQHVAGTKQAEQAAYNLKELGEKLREMVGKYRV